MNGPCLRGVRIVFGSKGTQSRGGGRVTHFNIGLMAFDALLCGGQGKRADLPQQEWIGDQRQAQVSKLCIF